MYPPCAAGIRFNDCYFTEPTRLTDWAPPRFTGLFVILARDPHWAPRSFQPLCFGEFGNNTPDPLGSSGYAWLRASEQRRSLFVSVLPMPFTTSTQRTALRDNLIAAYNPAWQRSAESAAPSAPLQTRTAPLRRRIGFQPETA
jgi:hypothetical protein